jgi:hypothetical protein
MEICGAINKTFLKPPVVITQAQNNLSSNQPRIYQVKDEEEEVFITSDLTSDLNRIFLSGTKEQQNIIIDTGSAYNLIGKHLIPIMKQRLTEAGVETIITPTKKKFQFGGNTIIESSGKIMVPLILGKTKVEAEVYILESEVPFLIGGSLLRQHKTEISVTDNKMSVNNHQIDLDLLPTGHMGLKWDVNLHKPKSANIFLTEKVSKKEWNTPEVRAAMEKEIRNLQENGTYEEVPEEPWMNVVPSMWVVNRATEDDGKGAGKLKARLVVRGDQDQSEDDIPCDSPTVDRHTVKVMMAVAANQGWTARSIDISAAFLQGREIERDVYIRPPPEYRKPGIVWKLKKGLYGLKEAARLWYEELVTDLENNGGQRLTGDPGCLLFHVGDTINGFVLIHVDDIFISGEDDFQDELVNRIKTRFRVSKDQSSNFVYTGMSIRCDKQGRIYLNQNQYSEELPDVPKDAEKGSEEKKKTILRGVVGKLLYLNLTRPDLSFKTNLLSRVPAGCDLNAKLKEAQELVEEARKNPLEIRYGRLGSLNNLSLEVYADAAYGGIDKDMKSTEGFIILLRGDNDRCSPIAWRSRIIPRVCKSVKTAETVALEDATDMAIGIGRQLKQVITGKVQAIPVPIWSYSDSKALIESTKSTKPVDEQPMRMHIERLKDHIKKGFVTGYKWVPTTDQLADPLTKAKAPTIELRRVLKTSNLKRPE